MKRTELSRAEALCAQYLDKGRGVLAAVSGGLDSMCLLYFLRAQGYKVSCAHFNHRLRGDEAARDEAFVRAWCTQEGIPFYLGTGDVRAHARAHRISEEEAGRDLRYAFLRETAEHLHAQLTLAHHADDNAETVLLNLIRGTDLRGLCGMRPKQGDIVRPFLEQTHEELSAYADAHGIPHVEDRTNADPGAAARNYLRLEIMPRLKTLNPRTGEHIAAAARSLTALDDAVERQADALLASAGRTPSRISLPLNRFRAAEEAVQARALLRVADLLGVGRRDIGREQLDTALALVEKGGQTRQVSLPRGAVVRVGREEISMAVRPETPQSAVLSPNVPLRWGSFELTLLSVPDGEGFSLRALKDGETVSVSRCDAGAYLTLAGASGARSVKRLCLDRRIPIDQRDALPALSVGGRLAAVYRLGTDTAFLPDEGGKACFVRITPL